MFDLQNLLFKVVLKNTSGMIVCQIMFFHGVAVALWIFFFYYLKKKQLQFSIFLFRN